MKRFFASNDSGTINVNTPSPKLGEGWGEVKKRAAFTLAEVLITLGIIGVVAALTMPALISKYQKHVWYTQFMKAATVIENAIQAYNQEYSCGRLWDKDTNLYDNLCIYSDDQAYSSESNNLETTSATEKLSKYINVAKWITSENQETICAGYNKWLDSDEYVESMICKNDDFYSNNDDNYAFITNDGMFINTSIDGGVGAGSIVDVNGPNKGPNIFGRDIFVFYLFVPTSGRWGFDYQGRPGESGDYYGCNDETKFWWNCGARLLQEGKMNY